MAFSFSKPRRRVPVPEIAPLGLVDVHNHVLFGVDDGARSVAESLQMLDGLAQLGYTDIAVSPHFDASAAEPGLTRQVTILSAINAARPDDALPRVFPGAEIQLDERFLDPMFERLFPPISGQGSTYLVELGMHPGSVPSRLEDIVFRLTARGLTLVLAHPERMADMQRDTARLVELRRAGMLLQLDVMALEGRYGGKAQSCARGLLERRGYDLIASDIHKPDDIELLRRSLLTLYDNYRDSFERLASIVPRLLLEGRIDELSEP